MRRPCSPRSACDCATAAAIRDAGSGPRTHSRASTSPPAARCPSPCSHPTSSSSPCRTSSAAPLVMRRPCSPTSACDCSTAAAIRDAGSRARTHSRAPTSPPAARCPSPCSHPTSSSSPCPTCGGMTVDQARAALNTAKLAFGNPAGNAGDNAHVVGQSPVGGARVRPGTTVTVSLEVPASSTNVGVPGVPLALVLAAVLGIVLVRRLRPGALRGRNTRRGNQKARRSAVHLVPRPDPAVEVRVLSSSDLPGARIGLAPAHRCDNRARSIRGAPMISARDPSLDAGVLLYGDDVIAGVAARIADPQTEAALRHRVGAVGAMALGTVETGSGAHRRSIPRPRPGLRPAQRLEEAPGTAGRRDSHAEPADMASRGASAARRPRRRARPAPSVDVLVNGQAVLTIRFELAVTITVDALDAFVRSGWLVGLGAGRCTGLASRLRAQEQIGYQRDRSRPSARGTPRPRHPPWRAAAPRQLEMTDPRRGPHDEYERPA